MTENRKTPKLRFKGFTDAWEQRKLGDVADIVGGGTPSTAISEYWDGDIDWYAPAEITNQIFVNSSQKKITAEGLNNSSAKMLPVGTVIFTSRAGIGKTAILTKEGCTNQGFQSIIPHKDELDSYFIFSRTDELKQYGETIGAGSTFVEVSGKQMTNMIISIPTTMVEQRQIGTYFRNLDNLITLHQRKLDRLKNIKKSMLDKMFPKDGEVVPEIRFKGFTDAWEQRKLGEVGTITSGFMGDSLLSDGKYHLTRIETIADGTVDENRIGYSVRKPDDIYLLKYGDILYSNINSISHMGKVAKYQGKTPLYHGINLLRLEPIQTINSDFMLYLLNTDKCRNWAKTRANQAVSQASINQSLLATQEIKICSTNEQQKIGQYFSRLDKLITLHQRKLDKLKNIKKSMLDNMFV